MPWAVRHFEQRGLNQTVTSAMGRNLLLGCERPDCRYPLGDGLEHALVHPVRLAGAVDGDQKALGVEPDEERARLLVVASEPPGDGLRVVVGAPGEHPTAAIAQAGLVAP